MLPPLYFIVNSVFAGKQARDIFRRDGCDAGQRARSRIRCGRRRSGFAGTADTVLEPHLVGKLRLQLQHEFVLSHRVATVIEAPVGIAQRHVQPRRQRVLVHRLLQKRDVVLTVASLLIPLRHIGESIAEGRLVNTGSNLNRLLEVTDVVLEVVLTESRLCPL